MIIVKLLEEIDVWFKWEVFDSFIIDKLIDKINIICELNNIIIMFELIDMCMDFCI